MGEWLSSKEFSRIQNCSERTIRHKMIHFKKILFFNTYFFMYLYSRGIGGGGKVLRIWSEPFKSEIEALSFANAYELEQEANALRQSELKINNQTDINHTNQNSKPQAFNESKEALKVNNTPLSLDTKSLEKLSIIKEWESAKKLGINVNIFVAKINTDEQYSLTLSKNKLFAWARAYKNSGENALKDLRGKNRAGENKIKELGIEELVIKLIRSSKGGINVSSLHYLLHVHLDSLRLFDVLDFKAGRGEFVSYSVLDRYIKRWCKNNPLEHKLLLRGEDAAVGSFMPAMGVAN